jgi:hypothetical protein
MEGNLDQHRQSKLNEYVGYAGLTLSIVLWLTLADQVRLNLAGQKGSLLVALAIVANCILWVTYGYTKEPKELKVAWANIPGVLLGLVNLITILR